MLSNARLICPRILFTFLDTVLICDLKFTSLSMCTPCVWVWSGATNSRNSVSFYFQYVFSCVLFILSWIKIFQHDDA